MGKSLVLFIVKRLFWEKKRENKLLEVEVMKDFRGAVDHLWKLVLSAVLSRKQLRWLVSYLSFEGRIYCMFFSRLQNNQADLENATEVLSGYLERDISQDSLQDIKQKVQDKYR